MEPTDFDKLIREKAQEQNSLYEKEIAASKTKVWSEIEDDLPSGKRSTKWYYWAAAILLFFVSFGGFLFNHLEEKHAAELDLLRAELKGLNDQKAQQSSDLQERDQKLEELQVELSKLIERLDQKEAEESSEPNYLVRESVIRDTVYIDRIEYQEYSPEIEETEVGEEVAMETKTNVGLEEESKEVEKVIYPSKSDKSQKAKSQSNFTLKVGPFSSQ